MRAIDRLFTSKGKVGEVTVEPLGWDSYQMCDSCKRPAKPLLQLQLMLTTKQAILIWLCKSCVKQLTYSS